MDQANNSNASCRLYVGNLHFSTTEGDLIKLFQTVGIVKKIDYMWHRHGPQRGLPKGFAFIEMGDLSSAAAAIKSLNGLVVRARELQVNYCDEKTYTSENKFYTSARNGKTSNTRYPAASGRSQGYPSRDRETPSSSSSSSSSSSYSSSSSKKKPRIEGRAATDAIATIGLGQDEQKESKDGNESEKAAKADNSDSAGDSNVVAIEIDDGDPMGSSRERKALDSKLRRLQQAIAAFERQKNTQQRKAQT